MADRASPCVVARVFRVREGSVTASAQVPAASTCRSLAALEPLCQLPCGRSRGRSCGRAGPAFRIATRRGGGAMRGSRELLVERLASRARGRRSRRGRRARTGPSASPRRASSPASRSSTVTRGLVEHADAVVQQRDQDAVDDEARRVVAADRMLAELLAERVRGLERLRRTRARRERSRRAASSGAGLKKCMPTTRSGVRRRRGDLGHRERRRVRREDGVRPDRCRSSSREELLLRRRAPRRSPRSRGRSSREVSEVGREASSSGRDVRGRPASSRPFSTLRVEEVRDPVARLLPELRTRPHVRPSRRRPRRRAARSRRPSRWGLTTPTLRISAPPSRPLPASAAQPRNQPCGDSGSPSPRELLRREPGGAATAWLADRSTTPAMAWPKPMHIAAMP